MGLRASVAISAEDDNGELKGFVTLTIHNGVVIYDTGKKSFNYPKGSIGDMNGFGNETKELPDNIEEIWDIMKIK